MKTTIYISTGSDYLLDDVALLLFIISSACLYYVGVKSEYVGATLAIVINHAAWIYMDCAHNNHITKDSTILNKHIYK